MNAVALGTDLIIYSRMLSVAASTGAGMSRVDDPAHLPAPQVVDLVLVDWGSRAVSWADELQGWRGRAREGAPRVLLYGPHTDLDAHAAARAAGLGPMWARSRLLEQLRAILEGRA